MLEIEVLSAGYERRGVLDFTHYLVTGLAKNISGKPLSYAEIRMKCYDEDGVVVDDAMTNITCLDADEKWRFRISSTRKDIFLHRLREGSCSISTNPVDLAKAATLHVKPPMRSFDFE